MNIAFAITSDSLTSRVGMADGMVLRNYFESPRLQIAELTAVADTLSIGLDLRRDSARTLVTGLRPDVAFNVQVWRGVVDGTLERYLVEFMSSSADGKGTGGSMVSTSSLFESARAENTPAVLFVQNGTMPGSALTADTRARIKESIAAGHVLVAPQQPAVIGGAQRYAWWQIDPRSGETIAVADDGRRAAGETVTVTMITTGSGGTALYVSVGGYGGWFFLAPGASAATFIQVISSLAGVGSVIVQSASRF
jgi:hypothetical protein